VYVLGIAQLDLQLLGERVDSGIVHVGDDDRVAQHPGEEHARAEPEGDHDDQHVNQDYSNREKDDRKNQRHQQAREYHRQDEPASEIRMGVGGEISIAERLGLALHPVLPHRPCERVV
jgi:hypothetical protein